MRLFCRRKTRFDAEKHVCRCQNVFFGDKTISYILVDTSLKWHRAVIHRQHLPIVCTSFGDKLKICSIPEALSQVGSHVMPFPDDPGDLPCYLDTATRSLSHVRKDAKVVNETQRTRALYFIKLWDGNKYTWINVIFVCI